MTKSQIINQTLWQELRDAINKAYDERGRGEKFDDDFGCLRDYAENISWHDALAALVGRETANERQHRTNRPSVPGFSAGTAARLIVMNCICHGSVLPEMPKATAFLVLRQTAVEAEVVGWIIRDYLDPNWKKAVASLDYAKLMAA